MGPGKLASGEQHVIREELAQYGGLTVMIPAAVVIAVWLWYSRPQAVKWWLMTIACTYSIVAFSKLLFKGWGVALHQLDIAVLSGHAMNTSLMVPVAMSLVARRINPDWRWPAASWAGWRRWRFYGALRWWRCGFPHP